MARKLTTRLTEFLNIDHPILLAPMDKVAGGRLAAAVSAAGGLGLIGGGYGDRDWLEVALADAGNQDVGIGFITWSAKQNPNVIDYALSRNPKALMVSFGDADDVIRAAKERNIPTLWQVQRLAQAKQAIEAGADILVVQGQEAGGHGMDRGLTAFLPAVRDLAGPDQIIAAAGGIADGRGLASALMLGADGVLMGTRFWASTEAVGSDAAKDKLVEMAGDDTIRTKVFDVARNVDWPWYFTGRVGRNAFSDEWHNDIETLKSNAERERLRYDNADPDDFSTRVVIAGEAVDLIDAIEPASAIIERTVAEAISLLDQAPRFVTSTE
ncbi:MAG: nitronate monooxygenase [Pseudomonadota bacterium]